MRGNSAGERPQQEVNPEPFGGHAWTTPADNSQSSGQQK